MSQYGLVNTIEPPILISTTQPRLIEFEVRFSAYCERVEFINAGRPVSQRIKAATIRQCIRPKLLHSLCILGRITGASKSEEATDDAVNNWFRGRLASNSRNLSDRVTEAINTVTYTTSEQDPANAPEEYVLQVITALDERNASAVIAEPDQCKELIRRLVKNMKPPELKQRLLDSIEMWTGSQKSDLDFFTKKCCEHALQVSIGEKARRQLKRRSSETTQSTEDTDGTSNDKAPDNDEKIVSSSGEINPKYSKGISHAKRAKYNKWDKPCLNEECSEHHRIRDCKITPPEEKDRLIKKYLAEKNRS